MVVLVHNRLMIYMIRSPCGGHNSKFWVVPPRIAGNRPIKWCHRLSQISAQHESTTTTDQLFRAVHTIMGKLTQLELMHWYCRLVRISWLAKLKVSVVPSQSVSDNHNFLFITDTVIPSRTISLLLSSFTMLCLSYSVYICGAVTDRTLDQVRWIIHLATSVSHGIHEDQWNKISPYRIEGFQLYCPVLQRAILFQKAMPFGLLRKSHTSQRAGLQYGHLERIPKPLSARRTSPTSTSCNE